MIAYLYSIYKNKNLLLFLFWILVSSFCLNKANAKEDPKDWKSKILLHCNTKINVPEQITVNKLRIDTRKDRILWVPWPKDFETSYKRHGPLTFFKIPYIILFCPFLIIFILNHCLRKNYKHRQLVKKISETPPENLLPAEMSYIYLMGYRHEALLGTLLDLHIKGFIDICKTNNNSFSITKTLKDLNSISNNETFILNELFRNSSIIKINDDSHVHLDRMTHYLSCNLTSRFKSYFTNIRKQKTLFELVLLTVFIPVIITTEAILPFLTLYLAASFICLASSKHLSQHLCVFPKKNFEALYDNIESFKKFLIILKEYPQYILESPNYDLSKDCLKKHLPYMIALNVVDEWDIDFLNTLKNVFPIQEHLPSLITELQAVLQKSEGKI